MQLLQPALQLLPGLLGPLRLGARQRHAVLPVVKVVRVEDTQVLR
jgi:hypothetical protein